MLPSYLKLDPTLDSTLDWMCVAVRIVRSRIWCKSCYLITMHAGIKTQIRELELIFMFTSHPKQEETNNLLDNKCSYKLRYVSLKDFFLLWNSKWNYHFSLTQSQSSIPNCHFKTPRLYISFKQKIWDLSLAIDKHFLK